MAVRGPNLDPRGPISAIGRETVRGAITKPARSSTPADAFGPGVRARPRAARLRRRKRVADQLPDFRAPNSEPPPQRLGLLATPLELDGADVGAGACWFLDQTARIVDPDARPRRPRVGASGAHPAARGP